MSIVNDPDPDRRFWSAYIERKDREAAKLMRERRKSKASEEGDEKESRQD